MNAFPEAVCELVARQFVADHLPQFKAWLQAHGVSAEQAEDPAMKGEVPASRQSALVRFLERRLMNSAFSTALCAGLAAIHLALAEAPPTAPAVEMVEVFTSRDHPLTNTEALPGAAVYHIDSLMHIQETLSKDLPADEETAIRIARQRATNIDREAAIRAAEGLAIAHLKYRLDRYPAVVFAGQSVVYGVTDLDVAKRIYDESREEKP